MGDYLYSDGTTSDGGLRKLYPDGTVETATEAVAPEAGKTVIGIVFHAGRLTQNGIGAKGILYPAAYIDAVTLVIIGNFPILMTVALVTKSSRVLHSYTNQPVQALPPLPLL